MVPGENDFAFLRRAQVGVEFLDQFLGRLGRFLGGHRVGGPGDGRQSAQGTKQQATTTRHAEKVTPVGDVAAGGLVTSRAGNFWFRVHLFSLESAWMEWENSSIDHPPSQVLS
jgi:hypothetical protein